MPTIIILDTSFILSSIAAGIDLLSELDRICDFKYKIMIPREVLTELEKLINKGSQKLKRNAKLALKIIGLLRNKNKIFIINPKSATKYSQVDLILVELSKNPNTIIATLDKELKKKIKGKKIIIRQGKYFAFC